MNRKSTKEVRPFASAVAKGSSPRRAMMDAGFSPSTARQGQSRALQAHVGGSCA